ncbi:hypothetical protein, partial [Vibrio cholerae]|uniref:hypothetical protein n=1 Tax=Vibrio cholerae TaxID=666 RepID=UPI001A9BACFF
FFLAVCFRRGGHFSENRFRVKHFFSIFFSGLLRHRFGCEPLLRQRGRIIEIRFTLASVF